MGPSKFTEANTRKVSFVHTKSWFCCRLLIAQKINLEKQKKKKRKTGEYFHSVFFHLKGFHMFIFILRINIWKALNDIPYNVKTQTPCQCWKKNMGCVSSTREKILLLYFHEGHSSSLYSCEITFIWKIKIEQLIGSIL